jgi:hypothetical protein
MINEIRAGSRICPFDLGGQKNALVWGGDETLWYCQMLSKTRNLLKRKLSPAVFHRVCYYWWYAKFYTPRRAASSVVRRHPVVHGPSSELADQLRSINIYAPTPMCRVMTKYSSDKGNSWHNYTTVYSKLFGRDRARVRRVFELGLGRDHPDMASTIGKDGLPGASLRGWREIFPHALVFGADIDRSILFSEDRIQTFYCDQLDSNAIHEMWDQPTMREPMDIIVEDGLHTFEGNASFLAGSLEHVRPGGYYTVEDILSKDLHHWHEHLPLYAKQYPQYDFALLELPNSFNSYDNNMLVVRRRSWVGNHLEADL